MDTSKPIASYLEELSSNSPTPGGGNVAALCGSLASSLGVMVCNLTIGKKKYLEVEEEVKSILNNIQGFCDDFVTLGKQDNAAFDAVMDAFKMPKDSDKQKLERNMQIENATLGAAVVPANVISLCAALLPHLSRIAQIGNQNSLSDTAVGIALVRTAAEGAFLNVLINCSSLSDPARYMSILGKAQEEYQAIKDVTATLVDSIINKLKPAAL